MPFIVNVKNNSIVKSRAQLFYAYNALTNNTDQYLLTTLPSGTVANTLNFSTFVNPSTGLFSQDCSVTFFRTNLTSLLTHLYFPAGTPFSALEQGYNTSAYVGNSALYTNTVTTENSTISVEVLQSDYSQVFITINNPPSATNGFHRVFVQNAGGFVISQSFISVYNTSAPPVGAGISIENNAYGNGAENYTEFLREVSVSPILFGKVTAQFSTKTDAFGQFEMRNNTLNESRVSLFRMQRSPYMNANTYQYPVHFSIDGFFGFEFNISPKSEVDLKFWDIKQRLNTEGLHSGLEDNMLGLK